MKHFCLALLIACLIQSGHSQTPSYPYLYLNPKATIEQRVKDLLDRMTLHEKILQMQHLHDIKNPETLKGYSYGCAVNTELDATQAAATYASLQQYIKEKTRWGIPVLSCTEALHGAYQGNCTVYPQAIAQGSTFNPELIIRMATLITKDLKAMNIRQVL